MKIGIDARSLIGNRRGVGHSLAEILIALGRLDSMNEYFLYSHKEIGFDLPNTRRWHKRIGNGFFSKIGSLWLQTQARRMILTDNLDIFWGTEQVLPLYLSEGIKKIVTIHDLVWLFYPETMGNFNLLTHRILVKPSIAQADKVICVSKSTAVSLANSLNTITIDKIKVISWGIDHNKFKPKSSNDGTKIMRKYGIREDYILYVGTIEPRKNLERLLVAFKAFKESCSKGQLVIAGVLGWKMKDFIQRIKTLDLANHVICTGYVPDNDKIFLMQNANIFVFPSLYEGFGLPVLEAMACGIPVITSNSSSLAEIGDGYSVLVDVQNSDEITRAMINLATDEKLRSSFIEKGLRRSRDFSWETSARTFMNICAEENGDK